MITVNSLVLTLDLRKTATKIKLTVDEGVGVLEVVTMSDRLEFVVNGHELDSLIELMVRGKQVING